MDYTYENIIEKLSKKGSVMGLENMRRLLEVLGHPEDDLKIIHIAGTNGKGSILAFLAEILMKSAYKVGRYISPTIQCYEERFQINHTFIEKDTLELLFHKIETACILMEEKGWDTPTIFEAETAIALLYFKEKNVDYALIETGMGGLLDATNAIRHPFLTLIASISEDHKAFLGNTITEIASQKAGIIKHCAPVVLSPNTKEAVRVIEEKCKEQDTTLYKVDKRDIIIEETPYGNSFLADSVRYEIRMPGAHQVDNALTAMKAAHCLAEMEGGSQITERAVFEGLRVTRWPGRLELLMDHPPFYLDGAHNPDGALKLASFLEKHFTNKKIVYIMGVLGDKEYDIMLSYLMPLAKEVYTFTPQNKRGLDAEILADAIRPYQLPVTICKDVKEAVIRALASGKDADCYVLCGSLSFIEEFRSSTIDFERLR